MKYDRFKLGEAVAMYSPYRKPMFLGHITSKYFMEFTQGNHKGGWYYNTEKHQGISGDLLITV